MRNAYDILVQKTEVCSVLNADGSIIHIKINLERGPYEQTVGLHFHILEKRLPADINFKIFANIWGMLKYLVGFKQFFVSD
jgi:hypothetical protein